MIQAPFAPLTAAFIRRGSGPPDAPAIRITLSSPLFEDVRLFAVTWATGFVFLLAFFA